MRSIQLDTRPLADTLWGEVFGDDHPVSVEIGPGNGEVFFSIARSHPERNFLGIERSDSQAHVLWRNLAKRPLPNARILHADARCVARLLPSACVVSYYVCFPDPWWKRRHRPRRLWSPEVVANLNRTLTPGGTIEFQTDVADYFWETQATLDAASGLERLRAGPSQGGPRTSFFRKALQRDEPIYGSVHRRNR